MKERLDVLLTQKGMAPSREKAKALIMAGQIWIDGSRIDKAGTMVDSKCEIEVRGDTCPYVSRGGLKLEKAMEMFDFHVENAVCCDMGASTGGFTDCMLQRGAQKVYAIDVGYGQLDYKLRTDPRVINMERTNIRYMDTALIEEPVDFISIDVSFISLDLILPVAAEVLSETGRVLCLVKPQFEAGRSQVGKKGIVRDPAVHKEVIIKVAGYAEKNGLYPQGLTFSPVTGAKGNIEYLSYLERNNAKIDIDFLADEVVRESHQKLA